MDARMKKFPLKLLVDWAAAATGLEVAPGQLPTWDTPVLFCSKQMCSVPIQTRSPH